MKSLNKAIDVLELFLDGEEEKRLSELSRQSGFDKSTVNRIVTTWVRRGYLKQLEKKGKYSLGMRFLNFSGLIKNKIRIRNVAMPYLITLSQLIHESVALSISDGRVVEYAEGIPTSHPLRIVPDEGSSLPLYCTSMGKVFLASMTEQELDTYLNSNELIGHTVNTLTDHNQLKTHLSIIAKEGVAYDDEEYYEGIRSVAVGIKDGEGNTVAAVGVLGPSIRLNRSRMLEITSDIKNCAQKISGQLTYKEK